MENKYDYLHTKGWIRIQDSYNFMPILLWIDPKTDEQYDDINVAFKIQKERDIKELK